MWCLLVARVVVLGGCGAVGSVAVRTLASLGDFSEVVVADIDAKKSSHLVDDIGSRCLSSLTVDVLDKRNLTKTIEGSDVVLNCVGPFYKSGPLILEAVIRAGVNYVDICDDIDATELQLKMDGAAKRAGVSACIGMGSSPGVTNLLAKFAADSLLETVESIDLYHAHGGEPVEGAGVIGHRIHCMQLDVPVYINGVLKKVKFFGRAGAALQEEVDFQLVGSHRVYPYPHPETLTLPNYIKCRRVTNKGTVLPDAYFQLTLGIVQQALKSGRLNLKEERSSVLESMISDIIQQRERILRETSFGEQRGCVKIVVAGQEGGEPHKYVFSLASRGQAMGEGTGIPAAFGAALMQRGKVKSKGVFPPEGCILPLDFLEIMQEYLKLDKVGGTGSPLTIDSVDAKGNVEKLTL
ncbi:MAG: saccharopine dehydrogenase [Candidatus Thorarchaeota archaeon]|nr:MAG: saccharopine dehydrogenase [Candidatus Thorarchaeota archaeon]